MFASSQYFALCSDIVFTSYIINDHSMDSGLKIFLVTSATQERMPDLSCALELLSYYIIIIISRLLKTLCYSKFLG